MYIFTKKDPRFFLSVFFFFCIFFTSLFYIFLEKYVEYALLHYFKNNWQCTFQGNVKKEGFLLPKIIIENPMITSLHSNELYWKATAIECSFSFFNWWPPFSLPMTLLIKNWYGHVTFLEEKNLFTLYQTYFTAEKTKHFFEPSITALIMYNAQLDFTYKQEYKSSIFFQNRIYFTQENIDITTTILNGDLSGKDTVLFHHYSGIIQYTKNKNVQKITVQNKAIDYSSGDTFYIRGSYENDHGRFSLQTTNPNLFLDPIIITKNSSKISGNVPLIFLQKLANIEPYIEAQCRIQCTADHTKNNIQGFVVLENGSLFEKPLFHTAKIEIKSLSPNQLYGPLYIKTAYGPFEGNYSYDHATLSGSLLLHYKDYMQLSSDLHFFPLTCKDISISCLFNHLYAQMSAYFTIVDTLKHTSYKTHLEVRSNIQEGISYRGSCDNLDFTGAYLWKKNKTGFLEIKKEKIDTLFLLKFNQETLGNFNFIGYAKNIFLKNICSSLSGINPFHDEGVFSFDGTSNNQQIIFNSIFQDGTLNFPLTQNLFSYVTSSFLIDTKKQECLIKKIDATGASGSLCIEHGTIGYQKNGIITACFIPATLTNCTIVFHPFFNLTASMNLVCSKGKNNQHYFLQNNMIIHEGSLENVSQLKDFIQHNNSSFLASYPIEHEIHIKTENPIKITSNEINTQATIDIVSKGSFTNPEVFGSIFCSDGELLFPYKPLYITKAHLLFSGSFQNANIELFAKNTVKNYFISMHAGGTLDQYSVFFDATPHLTKSHIISLLMFGTTEGSAGVFMPSFFAPRLKLGSLNIHFTPGFSDKSARGGIRGALEIAVNNRLHATILKNFTLSEDTRFEFSYDVTDAVSVRAIRDERRDIATEIEMRWKF